MENKATDKQLFLLDYGEIKMEGSDFGMYECLIYY